LQHQLQNDLITDSFQKVKLSPRAVQMQHIRKFREQTK
jgi:hypothetical protein